MQEQAESRTVLHDDPDLLARMLDFCYTTKSDANALGEQTCLCYAQLYTLGDKYGINSLQWRASKGLASALENVFGPKNADSIQPEFVDDLPATIAHTYHNNLHNDSMRKMLARLPWKSSTMEPYGIKCTELLNDNPEYAWDVILYNGDKVEKYRSDWAIFFDYSCPNCSSIFWLDRKADLDEELSCYDCGATEISKHFQSVVESSKPETREEEVIHHIFRLPD